MSSINIPEIHTLPPEGLTLKGEREVLPRRARSKGQWFRLGLSLFMAAIMIAGLAQGFIGGPAHLHHGLSGTWLDAVDAALVVGWMALFVVQVTLVFQGRRATHRKLGLLGVGYGVLFVLTGIVATLVATALYVRMGDWSATQGAAFLLLPIGDLLLFGALFAAGVVYRHRSDVHKRLMLLAAVALLFSPIEHLTGEAFAPLFALWMVPAMFAVGYDLVRLRRVHAANLAGIGVLLLGGTRILLMDAEPWLRVGRTIIAALVPEAAHGA